MWGRVSSTMTAPVSHCGARVGVTPSWKQGYSRTLFLAGPRPRHRGSSAPSPPPPPAATVSLATMRTPCPSKDVPTLLGGLGTSKGPSAWSRMYRPSLARVASMTSLMLRSTLSSNLRANRSPAISRTGR